MKAVVAVIFLVCSFCFISCKKDASPNPADVTSTDTLYQSVVYKTMATIPSPADSAKGKFRDSISVFVKKKLGDLSTFGNIPYVYANIPLNSNGFSFAYNDDRNSLPYFLFSVYAFPNVPRHFLLNQPYEYTWPRTSSDNPVFFLGASNGFDGMNYFVNNVYPTDATSETSKSYTSVTFTKRLRIALPPYGQDSALYGSGHISGYLINYYDSADTTKYVHRWDFTVDFTDLKIEF